MESLDIYRFMMDYERVGLQVKPPGYYHKVRLLEPFNHGSITQIPIGSLPAMMIGPKGEIFVESGSSFRGPTGPVHCPRCAPKTRNSLVHRRSKWGGCSSIATAANGQRRRVLKAMIVDCQRDCMDLQDARFRHLPPLPGQNPELTHRQLEPAQWMPSQIKFGARICAGSMHAGSPG